MQFDPIYNRCTSAGALTATGAETVYDTTVTIDFCVEGKAYTKTAVTDGVTPTTDGVSGSAFRTLTGVASGGGQGTVLVWCLNASGTVKLLQGSRESLDSSGNFLMAPQFPGIPVDLTPFAYQVLKHYGQGTTVTIGSSNWNTSGFSNAIVDVHTLPRRPQVS